MKSKFYLVLFAIVLALTGCTNDNTNQSPTKDLQKQDIIKLLFKQKTPNVLQSIEPGHDWTVTKEISKGDTMILVYKDASGGDYTLAKHAGHYYLLSGVYNAESIRIQTLEGTFGGIELIGGIGSDLTTWDVLGLDKEKKLVSFQTIGRPELGDLDGNGTIEMVASFEGAHLHYPNVEIVRYNADQMESAETINRSTKQGDDPLFARLINENGRYLIEIGKVREEGPGRHYKYDKERLVELTY